MQKRKKALIITLMIVTIIITILITFAVIYFTTDIFKNGQQAFIYAISKNMETFATLANTNTNIQEEFRKNYSYSSTGTINGNINQENVNQNVTLKQQLEEIKIQEDIMQILHFKMLAKIY